MYVIEVKCNRNLNASVVGHMFFDLKEASEHEVNGESDVSSSKLDPLESLHIREGI